MHGLLSTLIWLPICTGLLVLLLGERRIAAGRWLALAGSLATLLLAIPLWTHFSTTTAAPQFTELLPWIPRFHSRYAPGVAGNPPSKFAGDVCLACPWRPVKDDLPPGRQKFMHLL